ncbi:MAG: TolC family protein [Ignavibacteriales bacterium]|nr:TolC family protein [Ignavibacteriales bacterium]
MKNKILIISFIIASIIYGQNKKYSLDEIIQLGIQNSKTLIISDAKVLSASAKVKEINSQRLPQLKFNASYMRLSEVPPFEISMSFLPNPIRIQDAILNTYNLKLSLQQPIFTGFKLSSLNEAANYNLESAELDHIKEMNEETFKIISAFWNVYKIENANKIVEENIKSLEAHLKDSRNFLENDLITKNDILKLEVQKSSVQLKQIELNNSLEVAKALLNKTIGNNITDNIEITSGDINFNKVNFDFNDLLNEAKSNRLEIKSLAKKLSAGEEQLSASKSGWYPSVFLVSDFYYSRPNQRIFPMKDRFDDTWDVGISLSWDVWNWGYNSSQSQQAESNLIQLETSKAQLEDAVEIDVYNTFLQLQSAMKKVELNKLTVEQAEENYRITNDKYLEQLVSSTDLIDAETSKFSSQTELLNSLVDYELAKIKLDKAVGKKLY